MIENEDIWNLIIRLGRIANQLDLWADTCLSDGWSVRQVQPIRNLACEIRDELHGFVPAKEMPKDIVPLIRPIISKILRQCALEPDYPAPIKDYPIVCQLSSALQALRKELDQFSSFNN